MDPHVALLIYAAITILSAVLWHRYVTDFVGAVLGATVTTVVLFLFVDYLQSGHRTRNIEIAVLLTSVPALVVSLVVGLIYRAMRKARDKGDAG